MRWFARTEQLLGPERLEKLAASRVAIFGLGGVGSFAVEALARAGVGHIRLVDHDVVNLSNVNRQIFALHSTVGTPKVEVAAARVRDINPNCDVDVGRAFIHYDTLPELLEPDVDVVVDAIDSVTCKVALLHTAHQRGIAIVSSMGAGGRLDASQSLVGDLSETQICPLAAVMRNRLKKVGITTGIRCVFTLEPAQNKLPANPLDADQHVGPGRKRRPLGTISFMPALFGLRVAEETIRLLLEKDKLSQKAERE